MFTMEEADLGALELPGVRVEPVGLDETVAKFDLTATLTDHGETIAGSFVYATDLFEPATVERLARAYEHVVTAAVADTDRPLSRLTLADPVSPDGGVSGTGRAVPLPDLVAAQARRTPDAVAVQLGDETLTYADLDARADRLARWLADRGVTVDSPVGVALPRSPDLVVALLAVLKAGGAYVAVDPAHPTDRQAATFAHSGVRLVLTRRPAAALLPAGPHFAVHHLDDIGAAVRACAPTPLAAPIHLDTLAAIFTTSGSTGVPKAIATTHRGPANYMRYLAEVTGVSATDTVLQVAAPSFDASMREIFGALGHGARLLMLTDEQAKDPYAITRTITEHRVTALFSLVPSMLSAIAIAADDPSYDGASLRIGLVGGEALTGTHLRDAARVGPLMRVVNHYGPTECTMTSTYHVVTENDGAVPVGRPIIDARGYVVGLDGDALPAGALGELYLATPGLARGYVAAPDATAERFVPDPWGPPGGRLFRTGDLVRWRADDRLTFHGRLDDQIKLRGIRVEPGEIEAALRACSGVRAAAVVSRGESLRRELVACLVLDGDVAVEDLHARLAATLPAHLVPGRYAVLDALPHTPTGKVDRRRLGRMDLDRIGAAPGGASGAPARDALEMRMVTLWERLLERRPIGVNDNFFATGGHSLKAVELVDAVRREFGLPLPLNAVFTNPTIEGLCAVIGGSVAPAGLVVPLAVGAGGALPLFLVHPQGGDACCYAALARDLGADRDVYGIESVGYNTDEPPLNRVEAMAERYLAELREIRPDGPYALAGWSFGGNVAFEMAVRLEAAGETVAFLGAIDARVFGRDEAEEGYRERPAIERFGIAELARGDVDELAALDEQDFLDVVLREGRANGRLSLRADSDTMRRMLRVFTANGEAADHYRSTARVAVGVHLFKAMDTHPSLPNPVVDPAGWRERTNGRLHLVEMPGNHHDLVYPPRASALAERLRRAMTNPNQESAE
jgi:amino acid adenylation domain-containing protein